MDFLSVMTKFLVLSQLLSGLFHSFFKQGMIYIMKYFLSKIGMPPIAPASCFRSMPPRRKKAQGLGMGASDSGLNRFVPIYS
jgi:hypothetical protein